MSSFAPPAATPQQLQALWQHARRLQDAGQLLESAQAFQTLLQFAPDNWATFYNLGLVYQGLKLYAQARDVYQRAVELNPSLAQAYNNLGSVLWSMEDGEGALAAYRRATELQPDLAVAHYNKGLIEESLGQLTACVASMQNAVARDPANDVAWEKAFSLLIGLRRRDEAFHVFYEWEKATPICVKRMAAGMLVSRLTGDRGREQQYLAALSTWPFNSYSPVDLIPILGNLQYYDVTGETILACYRRFNRSMNAQQLDPVPMLPRRSAGKIRIGYASPDYRQHVMGRIMLEVMRAHDRERFEIYLISLCDSRLHDAVTAEFRALADGFADISQLKDRPAAQVIAKVDLDILVDLAGHTMGARPGVYAHKPARHIVTHLGYHGCLGMEAVEYKLTDRLADTDESVRYQIERPYYLDGSLFPFSHVEPAPHKPRREELRQALGVEGRFVFAAFVNPVKLSPRCLDAWKRVLDQAPSAVLAFSPYDMGDRELVLRILASAGIAKNRVVFISADGDDAEQRARYRAIDGVMDTFPYAGGDTTLAALDMNVPVVTLKGARNAERTGYSILGHLGVTATVAGSEEEFVALAVRLASDTAWQQQLVAEIISTKSATDKIGMTAHVTALERAFSAITTADKAQASALSARDFFGRYQAALKVHQAAADAAGRERAAVLYDALLAEQPEFSPLLYARGMLALDQGNTDLAAASLATAISATPADIASRVALTALLLDRGQPKLAIEVISPAIGDDVRNARVCTLAARAYIGAEMWQEAAAVAARAVALAPTDADALFAHGVALSHLSRGEEALAVFNRVLAVDGKHAEAAYNAAILKADHGDPTTAEALFRQAILSAPGNEVAYWRLGALLIRQYRVSDIVALAKAFAQGCPASLRARFRAAQALRYAGRLEAEAGQMRELAQELLASEDFVSTEELLRCVLAAGPGLDFPTELLRQLAIRSAEATRTLFGELAQPAAPAPVPAAPAEKIRIGYVVDEFCVPPRSRALLTILRGHDRTRYELHVFALANAHDAIAGEYDAIAESFVAMSGWTGARVVETLRAANLDVLVDTTDVRDERMAYVWQAEPARLLVQMPVVSANNWRCAGWRIADRYTELAVAGNVFPAPPLLVDFGFFSAAGIVLTEESAAAQPIHRSPRATVNFLISGCLELLSLRALAMWKSLLGKVPHGHLRVVLESKRLEAVFRAALLAEGIPATNFTLVSTASPTGLSIDDFAESDVALDSLPASDGFLVAIAAAAGVPAVTLAGQLPGERVGASVLTMLNQHGLIASSGTQYVEIATAFAGDAGRRDHVGEQLKRALNLHGAERWLAEVRQYEAVLAEQLARQSSIIQAAQ